MRALPCKYYAHQSTRRGTNMRCFSLLIFAAIVRGARSVLHSTHSTFSISCSIRLRTLVQPTQSSIQYVPGGSMTAVSVVLKR